MQIIPMRRTDRERSSDFGRRVAAEAPYGVLSTVSPEGTPYSIPVSPVLDGDVLYFHGAAGVGRKRNNMLQNAKVSMLFVGQCDVAEPEFSVNYRSAIFEGRAQLVTDETERLHALWLIAARYCPSVAPERRSAYMNEAGSRVDIWRIDVERITAKSRGTSE